MIVLFLRVYIYTSVYAVSSLGMYNSVHVCLYACMKVDDRCTFLCMRFSICEDSIVVNEQQ